MKIRKAFTLTEMLVVMGIIVMTATLAIPAVRYLMGSSSISMARNNLSALLAKAREEAIAVQDTRGIMFYVDKTSNRIVGVLVQRAPLQDTRPAMSGMMLLDAVPNRDSMVLPAGVRMQTVFNGVNPANTAGGNGDRYLGFNPIPPPTGPLLTPPMCFGGVILFDGNGKLSTRPYGFQLVRPGGGLSNIATMIGYSLLDLPVRADEYDIQTGSFSFVPGSTGGSAGTRIVPLNPVRSQVGIILFDYDAFKSLGFTDQDADLQSTPQSYATAWPYNTTADGDNIHSEKDEEAWLDVNSTPLMINRYDGTLIRAE